MNIKKIIKNLNQFPNNTRNTLDKVQTIAKELNKLTNEVDVIKNDLNIIFRYISGLELHPRMPERLIVNDYQDVSKDHLIRYLKSCEYIKSSDIVLDFACGCGYGSSCIKINSNPVKIIGCDIDTDVINFANKFFGKQGIDFKCMDITNSNNFEPSTFNIIISFETLEHISQETSEKAINNFYKWLKPNGKIICSVPNENINPYKTAKNRFHYRHFTHDDFEQFLKCAGFIKIEFIEKEVSEQYNYPLGREFDSIIAVACKK